MRVASFLATLSLTSCVAATDDLATTTDEATISVLRGTDRASAFSVAEATNLKNNHGVKWTGVYIGGPCSAGSGWTKAQVTALANATSWTFMPTYVGQQSSAICGAHTLTTGQGTTDGQAAANLMATFGWAPNKKIPVALDLEAGAYSSDPAGATNYVKGWIAAVHSAGYLAYIYSSPSAINHFGGGMGIDGVWVASYFYTSFQNVAPSDLSQIGQLFSNHNRAWQYAGDVQIAGVGGVDCNTSDLLLAPAPGGSNLDTPCKSIPVDGRIVDETETCFTGGGPAEFLRSVATAGYNNSLVWTHTTDAATEANFGQWDLTFDQAGSYHLDVYTAAAFAQSKQAKYVITASGATHDVPIDQTAVDGWQSLGDFTFAAGNNQGVHLADNTGEPSANNIQLVFDAVRVTPSAPSTGGDDAGAGNDAGTDDTGMTKHAGCSVGGGGAVGVAPIALAFVILRRRRR